MKRLELTKNQLLVVFKEWIDFLKKNHKQSNTAVGRRIGLSADKLNNIKRGYSPVRETHLLALAKVYPELRDKALSVGISSNDLSGVVIKDSNHAQSLSDMERQIEELKEQVKELTNQHRADMKEMTQSLLIEIKELQKEFRKQ